MHEMHNPQEAMIAEICHAAQMTIWTGEVLGDLAEWLNIGSYEEQIDARHALDSTIRHIVAWSVQSAGDLLPSQSEAGPVAWRIEATDCGASYFTRDASLAGARKEMAGFVVTPLYTHPANSASAEAK